MTRFTINADSYASPQAKKLDTFYEDDPRGRAVAWGTLLSIASGADSDGKITNQKLTTIVPLELIPTLEDLVQAGMISYHNTGSEPAWHIAAFGTTIHLSAHQDGE